MPTSACGYTSRKQRRSLEVDLKYRSRLKRHRIGGEIASYRTPSFLEYAAQPAHQLPGLELVHLAAGYIWDEDLLVVGPAVISLRDGADDLLWVQELPDTDIGGADGTGPVPQPQRPKPAPPAISASSRDRSVEEGGQ